MKSNIQGSIVILTIVFLIYSAIAGTVFSFRHPWATQTEKIVYFKELMLWQKVPYSEMRK